MSSCIPIKSFVCITIYQKVKIESGTISLSGPYLINHPDIVHQLEWIGFAAIVKVIHIARPIPCYLPIHKIIT
jgi:hypothetical protein